MPGSGGMGCWNLAQKGCEEVEESGADQGGPGDGEDPGPDNAAGDAPADGGKAARGADADDSASDRVCCTDGDAESGVHDEGKAAGRFRCEAAEGGELRYALAHGLDDAPAACHSAACHSQVAADDDPIGGNRGRFEEATDDERSGDNAHTFL